MYGSKYFSNKTRIPFSFLRLLCLYMYQFLEILDVYKDSVCLTSDESSFVSKYVFHLWSSKISNINLFLVLVTLNTSFYTKYFLWTSAEASACEPGLVLKTKRIFSIEQFPKCMWDINSNHACIEAML